MVRIPASARDRVERGRVVRATVADHELDLVCLIAEVHAATRMIRRKTNRRHIISDHHGRTAGSATLLVRAMDGILGTHSSPR
jgi:hypothetical protein